MTLCRGGRLVIRLSAIDDGEAPRWITNDGRREPMGKLGADLIQLYDQARDALKVRGKEGIAHIGCRSTFNHLLADHPAALLPLSDALFTLICHQITSQRCRVTESKFLDPFFESHYVDPKNWGLRIVPAELSAPL